MNWINFFFYVIVLNSLTGTVAYLLCKLLALVAKKYNAIRIIYPLYRLVLLFYIVPLGYIYIRCKCFVRFGANTLGDGFLGNQVIYEVMQCCLLIVLVNWFNPILRLYLDDLDVWGDISCDIHVCSHFLGGHARKYFDLLLRFSQEENRSEQLPAFVSQLNSEQSLGKRVEYMIRWQKAGKKTGVSVLLALALVIGSSVTAFASSTQVALQQDDIYRETRVQETDVTETEDLEEYVIPADQVDEEKWNNAIVYDDELLDPLSVQKNFDWKIPGNRFVRSGAFIKKAGSTIVVSCYVYDDRYHHVGIRRPDGSMLYVNGMHQVTKTFNCETTGTYYVYVENMRSKEIRAAGYFIK